MRPQRVLDSYGSVKVTTGVATANSVELIMMLFDGLVESLSVARGHVQHGAIKPKAQALGRASRIVLALQDALDFERGGDLAGTLNELYSYVTRRLLHIHAHNDLEALDEVMSMMTEIRQAWLSVPALLPVAPGPQRLAS